MPREPESHTNARLPMTPATLLLLAAHIAPGADHTGDVRAIARAVVAAVECHADRVYDTDTDEALMLEYAWKESRFHARAVNPAGDSLGAWQLRFATRKQAFSPSSAARIWYSRALAGKKLWPDEPLQGICGGGAAGRKVASERIEAARALVVYVADSEEGC